MINLKGKRHPKKPITQKASRLYSFMLLTIIIITLGSAIICAIYSLTNYCIKDIWFFQNFAIGGFTFIIGFLMGENAKQVTKL